MFVVDSVFYAGRYRLVQMSFSTVLVVYSYVERRVEQSELGFLFVVQHLYGFLDDVYDIIIVSAFVIHVILTSLSSVRPFCRSLCIWRRLDRLPICILSLHSLSRRIRLSRPSALSSRHRLSSSLSALFSYLYIRSCLNQICLLLCIYKSWLFYLYLTD